MRKILLIIGILCLQVLVAGCATLEQTSLPKVRSRAEIINTWGQPNKIYTHLSKLKYGADEVFVYVYPDGTEDYLYLKDGIVIKREVTSYENVPCF